MEIHIEYCVRWNYHPEFDRVSKDIKAICPNATIYGNKKEPRTGAFEVTLNGKLIYSKFETNSFPTKEEVEKLLIV